MIRPSENWMKSVCVCVCACARARARVCVCVRVCLCVLWFRVRIWVVSLVLFCVLGDVSGGYFGFGLWYELGVKVGAGGIGEGVGMNWGMTLASYITLCKPYMNTHHLSFLGVGVLGPQV